MQAASSIPLKTHKTQMTTVRKAHVKDVPAITCLLEVMAKDNLLLPVSTEQLAMDIRDFFVAENELGALKGCAALHIYSKDLAEIRSLAVDPSVQKHGIGKLLANQCIQECKNLGLARIFALTRHLQFFLNLNFQEASKEDLPEKVYKDCLVCPKLHHCDESAMIRLL